MTLFALILALILEQLRPLGAQLRVLAPAAAIADGMSRRLNDGSVSHGRIAWLLLVGLSTFATAVAYWLLWEMQPLFAFVFNIVVLYLCMGFRHDSHAFAEIHLALRMGELGRAQTLLGAWRGGRYDEVGAIFGRKRPAVGFSLDLKELVQVSPRRALKAAVRAPWGNQPGLRDAIAALRAAGETVVCALPGHDHEVDEFHCDRVLTHRDGSWLVQPV